MQNYKLVFLPVILIFFFSAFTYAQCKTGTHDKSQKCDTVKVRENCSEEKDCCKKEVTGKESSSVIKPFNEVCPVLGNKVDPEVKTVEYKGKVYGFCCPGCDAKFQKDPEKFIKNLSSDGRKFIKS